MKTTDSRVSPDRVLATEADLADLLTCLLRSANIRQMWLIMLDEDHRTTGPLMPMSGHPVNPDAYVDTVDLGSAPYAAVLANRISQFVAMCAAHEIVLVWERRGSGEFSAEDRGWAAAMTRHCRELGVALRAQFVLHDKGLRALTPDDYA